MLKERIASVTTLMDVAPSWVPVFGAPALGHSDFKYCTRSAFWSGVRPSALRVS